MTRKLSLLAALIGAMSTAQAAPLDLSSMPYATYGNANSYGLPYLAEIYDSLYGGGTGPGNPYYIASGPGQIKDYVVIYTGASGQGVGLNPTGFDDAYLTPSGHPDYASISGAVNVVDPGNKSGIANNDANTWDASVAALQAYIGTGNPLFLFNNNDQNSDPTLAVWAKLWITDGSGNLYCGSTSCGANGNNTGYLYLTNEGQVFDTTALNYYGDATLYNGGNITQPQAGTSYSSGGTDYVQSGYQLGGIDYNLGANQVAYAADVPLLNLWLQQLYVSGMNLNDFTMHLDLKLGCNQDAALGSTWDDCTGVKIDNGYEQLFLYASLAPETDVPEPNVLALLGLGLAALGLLRLTKK